LLEARAQMPGDEADATTTLGEKAQKLRDTTPRAEGAAAPAAAVPSFRRRGLIAVVMLGAVVLISPIVRTALPFFRSTSSQLRPSTSSTSVPPGTSVPVRDSLRGVSPSPPSTDTARANASPLQTSTAVSIPSTASDRGKNACDSGDAAACVALAQAAEAAKEFDRAVDLYLKACNGRAGAGCTGFGVLYNRGLGVTRDATQAAVYYERGCTLGDMAGCNNLGTVYQFGSTGFRDPVKAAGLYERACSNGQMDGCANLGLLLMDTPAASPEEKTRGRGLLAKACTAGIARACERVR
jgi:hypothetical protein